MGRNKEVDTPLSPSTRAKDNITIIGRKAVLAKLAAYSNAVPEVNTRNLKEVASKIKAEAKRLCPVDTGSLRKSIRMQNIARPAKMVHSISVRAGGYITNPKSGRKVDYASYVEFGTSRSRAQEFMRPAYRRYRRELIKAIRLDLSKVKRL